MSFGIFASYLETKSSEEFGGAYHALFLVEARHFYMTYSFGPADVLCSTISNVLSVVDLFVATQTLFKFMSRQLPCAAVLTTREDNMSELLLFSCPQLDILLLLKVAPSVSSFPSLLVVRRNHDFGDTGGL